ncbi:MAG: aminotransferase class I/II-fold pyridoxal phosphate-dependent enzyme [Phycisphaerales bacterium]
MDIAPLLAQRALQIDVSGIRRIFELGARLTDPINLSIGQPDFPVPEPVKSAAIEAIHGDQNGYTLTQGTPALRSRIARHLETDVGWPMQGEEAPGLMVTSGTSGALLLAFMALLNPGDEVIIPDPYFVIYPPLARMCGASAVCCDTYPDFRLTAERVEPLITTRTKAVLLNSPSNPAGVVASEEDCRELLDLCRRRNVVLISDEIYDAFTFDDGRTQPDAVGTLRCPSPARLSQAFRDMLLVRGFGKTYGCTGWRLGYAAGPAPLIEQMAKLQQYTFVCAPAPLQAAAQTALDTDVSTLIDEYQKRRDLVIDRLSPRTELVAPTGAFYAFPKVPEHLGLTGSQFVERCIERQVLLIPGAVFSQRDTHVRLSFAAPPDKLERGLEIIAELMR